MGRAPAYDTATVVASARNLFWKKGFDAVSLSDVEKATGLSRSSIYHAFGNMRGLFDAAVQDYLDTVVRPRIRPLQAPDVASDALARYLTGLADAIGRLGDSDEPTGCLLVGTAGTALGDDAAIRQVVGAYHAELLAAVTRGVAARFPDDDAETVAARATSIAGATIAAMTLARVDRREAIRLLDVTSAMIR
ncbi:TetR family transcriptional regulator [Gordonia sp. SID5947]|uniref:TetR/AcrR family transcriptional regulator n=1 Tax=Gordonia sp. SID5947 TaxID=2690315 RepID=UPI0013708FBC|nr:TetR/AcrR family transcriptional regulator [Gordonia sp. SID5947]MYR05859.1 TetR family transcriptional regulator [Gordonia sp. SID5947]